jgi:hypothetical protein
VMTQHYGGNLGFKYCLNSSPTDRSYTSVDYVGSRDLTIPSLTIFPNSNYQGTPTTFTASNGTLNSLGSLKSYSITGSRNWAIYGNRDYSGDVICLTTLADGALTHGAKSEGYLSSPVPISVGSYRQGCDGDGATGPNPRPPVGGGGGGSEHSCVSNTLLILLGSIALRALHHFNKI